MTQLEDGGGESGLRPSSTRQLAASAAISVLVGSLWLTVEFSLAAFHDTGFDSIELLRRLVRFVPWQLGLFAAIGLAIGALGLKVRLDTPEQVGLATALASLIFLLPPLTWGLVRTGGVVSALPGLVGVCMAIAAFPLGTHLATRRLEPATRYGLLLSLTAGWTLIFVTFLRRAAPMFVLTRPTLSGISDFILLAEVGLAVLAAGAVFLLSRSFRLRGRHGLGLIAAGILVSFALSWFLNSPSPPPPRDVDADQPDVFVVLIDTLRADHLGAMRDGETLTPVLDALADESIRFRRSFSPSSTTRTSMPSMMTSLPVHVVGKQLPPEVKTFAEHLEEAGYATYGLSSNPIVSARFGYDQGFDALIDPAASPDFLVGSLLKIVGAAIPGVAYRLGLLKSDLYYRPLSELRRRAVRLLNSAKPPVFLYLHTMDMHGPYLPPHQYLPDSYESGDFLSYFNFLRLAGKGRLADAALQGQLRNLRDRYAGELQYTDRQLGLFFEELRARGRWEETLIWVVSDHGEAFGEHDWAGHSVGLWPTLTQVPMMVRPPRSWNIAPRTVHAPVSTRDILPTTLSMLNLPDPGNVVGRDLSSLINGGAEDERRVVYSANTRDGRRTYSAVRGWWRLEAALDVEGRIVDHALYGLAESADEDEDVSALHPEVAAELVSDLEARLIEEARWNLDTSDVEIDALTRERLRSLGYAD